VIETAEKTASGNDAIDDAKDQALPSEPTYEREVAEGGPLGALKTPLYLRFWSAMCLSLTGLRATKLT